MPTKKTFKPAIEPYIVRALEWGVFTQGAPVKVSAAILAGKRGYKWVFRCHALNLRTGAEWIEVYGGNSKHQDLRAFKIEEVTLIRTRKKRKKDC